MSHFRRHDGEMFAEQVALRDIAGQFGTPTYVYSHAALTEHFLAYEEALANHPHLTCYAVKANSNLAVLNVLARLGAGFDIVSQGELERVIRAGGDPGKVIFSGVGKLRSEMAFALDAGIHCFNVESAGELETLSEVAVENGATARISIRVNPDVDARTHPYISTGLRENKFGIDIHEAPELYRRAHELPGIEITGIDCHIGSQLTEVEPFLAALDKVLELVDRLSDLGIELRHLDLGGGLGVRYRDEQPIPVADYVGALLERIGDRPLELILEPGRSIAANAGVLLTRVIGLKNNDHKHFAVVDGAMNDLIRPALYDAWMNIEPVGKPRTEAVQSYDIVGPVCETGDFLGKNRELALGVDELLCIHSAGAYGFVMSSNYNSRGRAAEIMVDGDRVHCIRQREQFADLIRGESVLPAEKNFV